MRIVVIGSTGMLGQAVARQAKEAGLSVVEVSRSAEISWDFLESSFQVLASKIALDAMDLLVNCVGWIPQKSTGEKERDERLAYALNVDLVAEISEEQRKRGFRWLQILTDCVFSGSTGHYSESAPHDPVDIYGRSKAKGETFLDEAIGVRCSIIGPDTNHFSGLYEWLRGQALGAEVDGYTNHLWNGVSTTAFGKLAVGIALTKDAQPAILHWIPKDSASKFELLEWFRFELGRVDLKIVPVIHERLVNRILMTESPEANSELWKVAGYETVPSIRDLVHEFVAKDIRR